MLFAKYGHIYCITVWICSATWTFSMWYLKLVIFCILGVAFLVAYQQNTGLIGKNGLLPANVFLREAKSSAKGDIAKMFTNAPTLLWFMDWENNVDQCLEYIALAGLTISSIVMVTGAANMIAMFALWVLYHSIVNVGQRWYVCVHVFLTLLRIFLKLNVYFK